MTEKGSRGEGLLVRAEPLESSGAINTVLVSKGVRANELARSPLDRAEPPSQNRANRTERGETKMEFEESRVAQGPSRIVVADDHPLFRSAIRHNLEAHSDLEVVAEAANGQQALELCRRFSPDLVLMDLRMPQMDGIAATHAINREFPDTPVLILTAVDESAGLSDSLEAGAAGYVLKDAPAARITDAVRRTLAGESALDEGVAMGLLTRLMNGGVKEKESGQKRRAANHFGSQSPPEDAGSRSDASLTPREVDVLRMMVLGRTNQQIARKLSISLSTVKRHVRHIREKLEASDRVQAAVRAIELGLLDERSGG
jgi:DNA-binding NarL/FixJ family response regulator